MSKETENVNLFEKKESQQVKTLNEEFSKKVNSSDTSKKVYSAILEEKIKEKEDWMVSVMKKAVLKHAKLEEECDKAAKIQPDVVNFSDKGVRIPSFSEKIWKEKNKPFTELKKLSEQIDKALTESTVKEFENLEKLL